MSKQCETGRWKKLSHVPWNLELVKPVMKMFRPEVTTAIRMHKEQGTPGFEDAVPTVNFMGMIQKLVSVPNIPSTNLFVLGRSPQTVFINSTTR